jgi:hypothetical protein
LGQALDVGAFTEFLGRGKLSRFIHHAGDRFLLFCHTLPPLKSFDASFIIQNSNLSAIKIEVSQKVTQTMVL